VLIGPPGTGKSQTIANIIATSLAQGRTVLFVAEKRAALEVVQKRLKDVGLADFCLDLFSAKASKTAVLEQLARARLAQENFDGSEWQRTLHDIKTLKHELNDYVRELHRPHRNGWTAYRAIGCLLRAEERSIPEIQFDWPHADVHDRDDYRRLVETVEEAAKIAAALGDLSTHAPLAGIERSEWSPMWESNLVAATGNAAEALRRLGDAATAAIHALALPSDLPLTPTFLKALAALIDLILDPAASDAAWAFAEANLQEVQQTLAETASVAAEHARLTGGLEAEWGLAVWDLPLEDLLAEWRAAKDRWFPMRAYRHRSVRARLAPAAKQRVPKDPSRDLETLIAMRAKEAELARIGERLVPLLGTRWQGLQTDFGRLDAAIGMAMRLRSAAADCISDPAALLALRAHLCHLLGEGTDLLGETGPVGAQLRRLITALTDANEALAKLALLCRGDVEAIIPPSRPDWPQALARHFEGWVENKARLRDWCTWWGIRKQAETLGLTPLIAAIEHGTIGSTEAREVFEANYARWWINLAAEDLPRVRAFAAPQHEQRVERFRELDRTLLSLSVRLVRARLAARIRDAIRMMDTEDRVLTFELNKRQRHLPIRQLFSRLRGLISHLTPCVMMSPLSVAQYLPANRLRFDLVIFDEASQIPTWDAIGVIGRGQQVIVAGDPKQLPPTRFFERQIPESVEENDEFAVMGNEDLESVLDECLTSGVHKIDLSWHYRSRHESLIAFSNYTYYEGRLVTFPSPVVKDRAVSYRHVPDGIYARGGARTNQAEAKAIVTEVVRRLKQMIEEGREYSIGIVTFNAQQQQLIEDLLDAELEKDPALERFFSDQCLEPVLVKNLENVQGEERDVIILSLTYGPDATGQVAMNFGPLNQAGGARRLNVAITRAREELLVFGALRPDHIDLARTQAEGFAHLKKFLMFAEKGAQGVLPVVAAPTGGDFESPFEEAVAERLRARGWEVHPQIGVSNFRIDLGVVDPDAKGEFLAGIECDGATYHRAAAARDRDRLRQQVLERLGWRLLRVWSTDWWTHADREVERLQAALTDLLKQKRANRREAKRAKADPKRDSSRKGKTYASAAGGIENPSGAFGKSSNEAVRSSSGSLKIENSFQSRSSATRIDFSADLDPKRFYDEDYRPRLAALVEAVLRAEGPMTEATLVQHVARAHGFQRAGRRVREAVLAALPQGVTETQEEDLILVWPPGVMPRSWQVFREPEPGAARDPAEIPIEELEVLARRVLAKAVDEEHALVLMREACGLERLRETARARFRKALSRVTSPRTGT